ncbi:hypothetical protein ACTXT7_009419 [Hymenolepis weldensis]
MKMKFRCTRACSRNFCSAKDLRQYENGGLLKPIFPKCEPTFQAVVGSDPERQMNEVLTIENRSNLFINFEAENPTLPKKILFDKDDVSDLEIFLESAHSEKISISNVYTTLGETNKA